LTGQFDRSAPCPSVGSRTTRLPIRRSSHK
jgi:hypothetical protein